MLFCSYECGGRPASPMTDYEVPECNSGHLLSSHHNTKATDSTSLVVCNNIINNNNNSIIVNSFAKESHNNRAHIHHDRRSYDTDKDDDVEEGENSGGDDDTAEYERAECDPAAIELSDLRWVSTLGVGGFGRVELVTAGKNNNTAFALKKMKKAEVRELFFLHIFCKYSPCILSHFHNVKIKGTFS